MTHERDVPRPADAPRTPRPLVEWDPRPRILITNDDGIEASGLLALRRALETIGDTYVMAPETNQSAAGHSQGLWPNWPRSGARSADSAMGAGSG